MLHKKDSKDIQNGVQGLAAPPRRRKRAQKIAQLKSYIEIANKLPSDRRVSNIELFLGDRNDPEQSQIEFDLKRCRVLLLYLEEPDTPPDFRGYILEGVREATLNFLRSGSMYVPDPGDFDLSALPQHLQDDFQNPLPEIYSALRKYDEFREVRYKLRAIARINAEPEVRGLYPTAIPSYSYLYCDSQGILQRHSDLFAETVCGLEAGRIRECPICQRIFWADRIDRSCCSKSCSNVYNVRRSRSGESKKRRSENKKHKRRMAKRKNKPPSLMRLEKRYATI